MPPSIPTSLRLRPIISTLLGALVLLVAAPAASQAAVLPGWQIIGATGPTNLPPQQSEIQRVTVSAEGGTYSLSPVTAEGEGTLSYAKGLFATYAAGATQITFLGVSSGAFEAGQAIISGPGFAAGTTITAVSGDGKTITLSQGTNGAGSFATVVAASDEVTSMSVSLGGFHTGDTISGPGIPDRTTVTQSAPASLTLSRPPTDAGVVELSGSETTGPIAFDAPPTGAGSLQAALESLPAFGPGSTTVVGGPGDASGGHPYSVTLEGVFAGTDVPLMASDDSGLSGTTHSAIVETTLPGGAGTGQLVAYVTNVGGAASTGASSPIKVSVGPLPSGITATTAMAANGTGWTCTQPGGGGGIVECQSTESVPSGSTAPALKLPLTVGTGAPTQSDVGLVVEGGGASQGDSYREPITISTQPAKAGIEAFWAGAFGPEGRPATQAGGHPYAAATGFLVNTILAPNGAVVPAGDPRDVFVDLPPGFLGNPLATPRCPQSNLFCGPAAVVGIASPILQHFGEPAGRFSIYNDRPSFGYPAEFSFPLATAVQSVLGVVRSDGDYGITVEAPSVAQVYKVYGSVVTLLGQPPSSGTTVPFLSNPTDCAEQARRTPVTTISANSWQDQDPDAVDNELTVTIPPVTNCAALADHFNPSFSFRPQASQAASPTSATAHLAIPQEGLTDPGGLAAPELKKAVVILPRGVNVNPASADGLAACTEAQMGLTTTTGDLPNPIRFDKSEPTCPDASKLGTVEAKSPLLEETLGGTIYLAAQEKNPFGSLLALYLVIDSPRNGVLVKLPGEVRPDPVTGQLTATFDYNPQLPVEDLRLNFRGGGPRSPLATPAVCGTYTTRGELTPWSAPESGPPAQTEDNFSVTRGPGGGACATSEAGLPFSPSFEAGTSSSQAGAYAPLVVKVSRRDGEQELTHLEFSLPPGLTGKLAGIPYCPEQAIAAAAQKSGRSEQASPSCPAASQLGTVDTAAGVGPQPIHVGGHVYLAGPYKGAPLSAVVITPAVAGPFDLGDVVVRAPLYVNPETAQITARSDEIPHILRGIPLQVRSVEIKVDRRGFILNPTSCDEMTVGSSMGGLNGGSATPSSRFQVGNCGALGFKPNLKVQLKVATGRTGHPALRAVVTMPVYAGQRRCVPQGRRAERLARTAKAERRQARRAGSATARRRLTRTARRESRKARRVQSQAKSCLATTPSPEANIARAQVNLPHGEFLDQGNLNRVCRRPVLLAGDCPKSTVYGHAKAWTPLLARPLQGRVYLVGGYGYKLPALVADLNGQIRITLVGKVDSGKNRGIRNTFEVVPDAPVSRFVLEMKGGKKYGLLENSENLCKASKAKRRAIVRFSGQNGKVRQWKPVVRNDCGKTKKKTKTRVAHS